MGKSKSPSQRQETTESSFQSPESPAKRQGDRSVAPAKVEAAERKVLRAIKEADVKGWFANDLSLRRGKNWLTRLAKGSTVDLRSNATKKKSYAVIDAEFGSIYERGLTKLEGTLRGAFIELEESNRKKMGSKSQFRSFYEDGPEKLMAVLSNKQTPSQLDRKALSRARDRLVAELPCGHISCCSVDEAMDRLRSPEEMHSITAPGLDTTTNVGWPWYVSGYKPTPLMTGEKRKEAELVWKWLRERAHSVRASLLTGREVTFHAIVGQRLVNRGPHPLEDKKTKRLILAMEKSDTIMWQLFLFPLMAARKRVFSASGTPVHVAWMDAPCIDTAMQRHMDYCKKRDLISLSGDFSGFDASVIPDIWLYLAEGMSSWFKSHEDQRFFKTLNRSNIAHVEVLSPLGVHPAGPSSIKSGSGGTNFIDSMYNLLSLYYCQEIGLFRAESYHVQGDDFDLAGQGVSDEAVAEGTAHLGLIVHPDKGHEARDWTDFLQRKHFRGGYGGNASVWRVLSSCLVYEKLSYSTVEYNPAMEAIQLISKLENAAFNPMFEDLVEYVASLDNYRLFRDVPARQVIKQAGPLAKDMLGRDTSASISTRTMEGNEDGFSQSAVNRVLRGEKLPPWGSDARWGSVYGIHRMELAKAETASWPGGSS